MSIVKDNGKYDPANLATAARLVNQLQIFLAMDGGITLDPHANAVLEVQLARNNNGIHPRVFIPASSISDWISAQIEKILADLEALDVDTSSIIDSYRQVMTAAIAGQQNKSALDNGAGG